MTERKQLVVVVEGTSALGGHWRNIVSDYLEKVIRSFYGDEDPKPDTPSVELALVVFNVHGSYSSCLVQRSGWTKNVEYFMDMIRGINFNGGGFCDAAIAEGLADVLMMCPVNGIQNHQRHCILIAASNPYLLPTPVYIPPNCIGTISNGPLSDAETVAKYFKQSLVSLSVICPRQLPKLKAIYNAAKRNPSETDLTIQIVKNTHYLVLISESFMEALTALSQLEITKLPSSQSPTEMEVTPVQVLPQTSVAPVIESPLNQQPKIPPETVKEPNTVSVIASSVIASALSIISASQEMTASKNDNVQHLNPVVASATITKLPLLGNANVVNDDVATNVGPASQQTSSARPSEQSRYVKLWEGDLTVERQGKHTLITKLQGYRNTKASESLAEDWPSTMQVDRFIPEEEMKNKKYSGKLDYVIFRAMNEHSNFLLRMQEKKLTMVIQLPSQTLLLTVSTDRLNRLVGTLLPQEVVKYKERESMASGSSVK